MTSCGCVCLWCVLLMVHKVDKLTVESQSFESYYSKQYFAPLAKEAEFPLVLGVPKSCGFLLLFRGPLPITKIFRAFFLHPKDALCQKTVHSYIFLCV